MNLLLNKHEKGRNRKIKHIKTKEKMKAKIAICLFLIIITVASESSEEDGASSMKETVEKLKDHLETWILLQIVKGNSNPSFGEFKTDNDISLDFPGAEVANAFVGTIFEIAKADIRDKLGDMIFNVEDNKAY